MTPTTIVDVTAWEALDSRGTPTVACAVHVDGGGCGTAIVPSGASTGAHEASELRDGGDRYGGQGVGQAVGNVVEVLAPAVAGMDPRNQEALDARLREADGTSDLRRLGANAVLGVSVAAAVVASHAAGVPLYRRLSVTDEVVLPMPMVNIVSGGAHAGGAVDIQDVLAVPVGASTFSEAIEWAWRVRRATQRLAAERGGPATLVADEGGVAVGLPSNRAALELVAEAIGRSGLSPGREVGVAVDVAAAQFHGPAGYRLATEERVLDAAALVDEVVGWCDRYPIVSVEDPLGEDDWSAWRDLTVRLGDRIQIVGDDLLATNADRLRTAIDLGIANAVLIKPNQIGTLSDAAEAVRIAQRAGYATVVSARSGDTEDAWLSDLAIAWGPGQIKVGSTMRSERTAKWNRLLRIEAELGDRARFAGGGVLAP